MLFYYSGLDLRRRRPLAGASYIGIDKCGLSLRWIEPYAIEHLKPSYFAPNAIETLEP